jgi:iron only hydrogenase large subunit-like protein
MGMFVVKGVDFNLFKEGSLKNETSGDSRGLLVEGGAAQAVVNVIKKIDPTREVKVESAQGLAECKKMLQMAKIGKFDGYLLEGMPCPMGCVSGASIIAKINRTKAMASVSQKETPLKNGDESKYKDLLKELD